MTLLFLPRVPPGLARRACEVYSPLYGRELGEDDGRRITQNLLGAYAAMKACKERLEREAAASASPEAPARRASRSPKAQE